MSDQARHIDGTKSLVVQGVTAYVLLAMLLWGVYTLIVKPVTASWSANYAITETLQAKLNAQQNKGSELATKTQRLQQKIERMTAQGGVSTLTDASLLSHQLQEMVKQLLSQHAAKVVQLKPGISVGADALSRSNLDIRFRVNASNIDGLLEAFANVRPEIRIELLSLRHAATSLTKPNDVPLDGSLNLSVLFFNEPLVASLASSGVNLSVLNQALAEEPGAMVLGEVNVSELTPYLAGLFDARLRDRMRDARPEHYRLVAITLSSNAQVAVIADPLSNVTRRMRVNERLDDWRIEAIEKDGVTLTRGQQTTRLELATD